MGETVFNVGYYCSVVDTMGTGAEAIHTKVRERYSIAATGRGSCQNDGCCANGYSRAELERIPTESVLGLGSGNPVRHAQLRPGESVVDLGSGGGIDVFLASSLVGPSGSATGRSEEHTSELQSPYDLVCRLLLEKKNIRTKT